MCCLEVSCKETESQVEEVDQLIRDLVKAKVTKVSEIIKRVREKLVERAVNFKCSDVLPSLICDRIHSIAERLKIKVAKIDTFLKGLVARGITRIRDIIEKIRDRFFPKLEFEIEEAVTCEDILPAETCAELRAAAEKLKVKVEEIDRMIRALVKEKITKAKEIIKRVREKIIELAKDFKCTDVLSEKACAKIHEIAEKLKVKVAAVDKFLKELVAKGITKFKEIIEKIRDRFFPHLEDEELYLSMMFE